MIRQSVTVLILALGAADVVAQDSSSDKSLAATLDVYVFPKQGQDASQQSTDEAACYQWAVSNSGVDPFESAKQVQAAQNQAQAGQQQAADAGRGAGARGAVGGAAAGALIGEIASDDAGEGAAWGAAAGAVMSRRRARRAGEEAAAEGQQQVADATALSAEQKGEFDKAFSVCLEAKDYLVKY